MKKTFNLVKSHFENFEITLESHFEITSDRGLVMHIFDITMNLVWIGVLCVFGNQYNMGRVLSYSVILRSNVLQYSMLLSISSSIEFCPCEYFDVEFLFLIGETSPICLYWHVVFSTYKCKIVGFFISGDNYKFWMKFFQVLFNIWITQYWFHFLFKLCYFFSPWLIFSLSMV